MATRKRKIKAAETPVETTPAETAPAAPPAILESPPPLTFQASTDPVQEVPATTAAAASQEPAKPSPGTKPYCVSADYLAGVRLLEDKRFRQMQLKFEAKPSDAVLAAIREAGFQWRSGEQAWTIQIDNERGWQTRADAQGLFNRVSDMIREERGVGRSVS